MSENESASEKPVYPIVLVECAPDESDTLIGQLTMLGAEGIEERDATTLVKGGPRGVTLSASFGDFDTANEAVRALREAGVDVRLETLEGDEWRDAWREHWKPTRLGERVVVVPSWIEYEPLAHDVVLQLDPGRAFGTGQHASTALACAAIERELAREPFDHMLDVGCGSGILCFAALLLGLPRATACDTDEESIEVSRENAAALGLASRVDFYVGTSSVLQSPARLVVANIEAHILIPMADELARLTSPGGTLVLSGILATQRDEVSEAFARAGFTLVRCDQREDWIAPEFVRA